MQPTKRITGFTLVELSIVIVIIGLIVSGVTAGSSLVRQAKIRSVLNDINKIKTSLNVFRLQYNALPGDMANASSYWTGLTTNTSGTGNGNGNGMIENTAECYALWQHLTISNLYPGQYPGTNIGGGQPVAGINVPNAPLSADSRYIIWRHNPGIYGKVAHSINLSAGSYAWNSAVTAKEAYSMDAKIDDGLADKGKVYTAKGADYWASGAGNPGVVDRCISGTSNYDAASASYNLADTGITCWMFFWM